jgi:hypothetical protein
MEPSRRLLAEPAWHSTSTAVEAILSVSSRNAEVTIAAI